MFYRNPIQGFFMPLMERGQGLERAVSFNRILIATDLSEASEGAEKWGPAFARYYRSEAYLVHAIAPKHLGAVEEQRMKILASDLRSKQIVTHIRMQRQPAVDLISWVVDCENIDLLILGTHGRGGLKKLALGSVAEELSRLVPCPVLTVGRHVPPITVPNLTFAHILLATDFGRTAEQSLRYAVSLAAEHRAQFTILHTIPPMPLAENISAAYCPAHCVAEEITKWQNEQRLESIQKMESLVPQDAGLAVKAEHVIMNGFLPESIMDVARERNADLIVMGAHNTDAGRMSSHDPGTVLHSVIAHAHCPVLTVTRGPSVEL
jgi:nucleotide-binding universal stress UspA family protein